MSSESHTVGVIGGGAAGYFAAIQVKIHNPKLRVLLFEGTGKVLSKVLISGGGRCNVTNYTPTINDLVKNYPRGEKELIGPFHQFGPLDTMEWFESRGVALKIENDKRVFPVSDNSSSIADLLIKTAIDSGIEIRKNSRVELVEPTDNEYVLHLKNSTAQTCNKVVIATGGIKAESSLFSKLHHTIIPPVPSLFTFNIKDPLIDGLSGASVKEVNCYLQFGKKRVQSSHHTLRKPLLITHWGLSGPAVIVLSAICARDLYEANYKALLFVNFVPQINSSEIANMIMQLKERSPKKNIFSTKIFDIPNSLWERILRISLIPEDLTCTHISRKQAELISKNISTYEFLVDGKGQFKEEFVTAGGISRKEIDFKTMQSKLHPGLYFCGEVIDIDGVTGGFNFQAAWTTGFIVGKNIPLLV